MNPRLIKAGNLAMIIAKYMLFILLRALVIGLHVFAAFWATGLYILAWAIYGVIIHARKA